MIQEQTSLSHQERKLILSLHKAKGRKEHNLFVAEGPKLVKELLVAFSCRFLITIPSLWHSLPKPYTIEKVILLPESYDFSPISSLQTPRPMIGIFKLPEIEEEIPTIAQMALLLDNVQDPGNVGSILRTCDWFGIRQVFVTQGTADVFSPKVVQATMGGLARVKVYPIADIDAFMQRVERENIPIWGTFLEGENLLDLQSSLPHPCEPSLWVMGNEGKGISEQVAKYVTNLVTIPPQSPDGVHSESLNVAVATAIVIARCFLS
ncbi:TrmH family RNA methyltransferase [Porphyromonas circumdentaria]|uniref:RNA methyltransferase, TrmH family n=1 Tax=Porphyromonas circumdentaria TaxID=29524 RepID=A0A1T4LCB2_9PORP|nr:RNA methyltransferase [Porphyromonas circumdentaria]MBB6275317.1 TrmH family RNA methyltransferase [Porphyromonas circumdentaria]SJZ52296.1 RNA methyltransferase, TrmH family [Porphyromonas circumdentaria]